MKTTIVRILLTLMTLASLSGCALKLHPDPLKGWRNSGLASLNANTAITNDYQGYIRNLSSEERKFIGTTEFFEDGMGQHAVEIRIDLHGTWWKHVLIYDGSNNRTKVIKYKFGNYRS